VTVVAIPATPGTISFSSTEICAGATFTATVADVEHATSYEWTLPTGLSFVGASNGATITIRGNTVKTYAANSISVKAKNSSCSSGLSYNTQAVTVVAIPATPGTMTLSPSTEMICGLGTPFTATVPSVAGVSYVWSLPAGLSGSSTSNSITIRGNTAGTYLAGSISVKAMDSSCSSNPRNSAQDVSVGDIPAAPTNGHCGDYETQFVFYATPPADCTIDWYDAPTGGTLLLGSETLYRVDELSKRTTFYAESRDTTTGCVSSSRLAIESFGVYTVVGCSEQITKVTRSNVKFVNDNLPEYPARNGITLSTPVKIERSVTSYFAGAYDSQYRDHSISSDEYGSWFSWCMVATRADFLCPDPWRVPSLEDFQQYSGIINGSTTTIFGRPVATVSEAIDGWLLGGMVNNKNEFINVATAGFYWTSTGIGESVSARNVQVESDRFFPYSSYNHGFGFSLRCVK
jgi:uncharacterized protein (TIGR02145 family)